MVLILLDLEYVTGGQVEVVLRRLSEVLSLVSSETHVVAVHREIGLVFTPPLSVKVIRE
jgi:hypothetical protein